MKKTLLFVWFLLLLSALATTACIEEDDDDDDGSGSSVESNKCDGDCSYCPDKTDMYCSGTTSDESGDTWCWYCYTGQTCNAEYNTCQ